MTGLARFTLPFTTIIERVSRFLAAFAAELERVLALRRDDAVEAGEEVHVPEGAAVFAVGDGLQAC